ncbi:MAG: UDP-glucose 4-epimerase GalE [Frankiaceae bacterium]
MRLLVTGGAGYIGSVVTRLLVAEGHEATVLDDLSTGHADAVPEGVELVTADVRDAGRVLERGGYGGVLHFAAKSLVGQSVTDPSLYWATNVEGTRALLDAVRAHGVERFVFSSTAATYGEPEEVPIDEDAPTRPTNPYGAAKLAADLMIRDHAGAYGFAAVSLRYFNVAGANQGAGERHHPETHLVPNVLAAAMGRREQVDLFGDDYPTPDGTCIRDYVHVADLARAHLLALDAADAPGHAVYNLGNGDGYSVRQVIDTAERVTGRAIPVRVVARRPGDPARLVASSARIGRELGWRPEHGIDRIVADAWDFHAAAGR